MNNPYSNTLDDILRVYNLAVKNVEFNGPTLFAPIIRNSLNLVKEQQKNKCKKFNILLIMTDGEIHDMDDTINLIIEASYYPISILIIGIGQDNFDSMEYFNNHDLKNLGMTACRKVVQFSNTQKYNNMKEVSKELLKNVPNQITAYYKFMEESYN